MSHIIIWDPLIPGIATFFTLFFVYIFCRGNISELYDDSDMSCTRIQNPLFVGIVLFCMLSFMDLLLRESISDELDDSFFDE